MVYRLNTNVLTTTQFEVEERWLEHFTNLFNQPGETDPMLENWLPAQKPANEDLKKAIHSGGDRRGDK